KGEKEEKGENKKQSTLETPITPAVPPSPLAPPGGSSPTVDPSTLVMTLPKPDTGVTKVKDKKEKTLKVITSSTPQRGVSDSTDESPSKPDQEEVKQSSPPSPLLENQDPPGKASSLGKSLDRVLRDPEQDQLPDSTSEVAQIHLIEGEAARV